MPNVDIVRNVKLLKKVIERLESMASKPKTCSSLLNTVTPISEKPVITLAEPCTVLQELQSKLGEVKVNIQYKVVNSVDPERLVKAAYKETFGKAKRSSRIVIPIFDPKADITKNIVAAMKDWVDKKTHPGPGETFLKPKDFEQQFVAHFFALQKDNEKEVAERILGNLIETGYISVGENEALQITGLHTQKAYTHTGTSSPQILMLSAHAYMHFV